VVHEDHSMMIRWDIIPGKSKKKQPVSPAKSKSKPQG